MNNDIENAPCEDVEGRVTADREGKRRTVVITVDYYGNDITDPGNYYFSYSGSGIFGSGNVLCPGPVASNDKDKYRLRFKVVPGETIDDVTFSRTGARVDFEVGVLDPVRCVINADADELDDVKAKQGDTLVTVRNHKRNSTKELGYRFTVMVTHFDDQTYAVPADPRIINRMA